MKFKIQFYIFVFLLLSCTAYSQTVEKNDKGEMIVKFDDGSWRYYEASDSILVNGKPDLTSKEEFFEKDQTITISEESKSKNKKSKTQVKEAPKKKIPKAIVVADLLVNPPPYECKIASSGTDEYTKKKRIDLQKEILFDYTDAEVATYLKGRSYVTCEANFVEFIGDVRILTLKITVASRMARAEYGYLNSNTLMSIKLLNGENVTLFSNGSDVGQVDNENNLTVYKANFPVSRENQKVLLNSLMDKIKIVWSTGYEEYPVTNIDFFMNQIRCLNNQ